MTRTDEYDETTIPTPAGGPTATVDIKVEQVDTQVTFTYTFKALLQAMASLDDQLQLALCEPHLVDDNYNCMVVWQDWKDFNENEQFV